MDRIILFDGECNFCDKSVQFIIKRDPTAHFKFASLQSDVGRELLEQYQIPNNVDSIVYIKDNQGYIKSSAALRICRNLKGGWKVFNLFLVVPRPIRDYFYDIIAKNRYKWLGKKESCMLPTPEQRNRFL